MKAKIILILIFLILGFLITPGKAFAATLYVNYTSGNDTTGNGSSGNPYKTFHKGYTMATAGDTLNLTGTFSWTNADETGDVVTTGYTIGKNLTIQGQKAGETIVQAAGSYATGDRTVFTISAGVTAIINDITVRYGYNRTGSDGGGINNEGTLTVNRSSISYNYVWYYPSWGGYGGGIRNAGTLTVNDSTVDNNFAQSQGGGIVNAYTASGTNTAYITNSTIAFNSTADVVATVGGAGIFLRSGTAYVTNCTVAYNYAPEGTGDTTGIDVESATLYIKNSIVAGNKVTVGGTNYNVNYASGNFFDIYNWGTVYDNGGNIFGKISSVSLSATTWYDINSNGAGDNIFTLNGTATTGSLYLDSSAADNGSLYGNNTLAITDASSIAVNRGLATANGSISIPSTDQRGATRDGTVDIGSYEYNGGLTVDYPTIQASTLSFSSIQYNQMTIGWTNGNGSKRAVFMKQANSGTAIPADATTYTANVAFGSGTQIGTSGWYNVYNGSGTSVTITGLTASTSYIVQTFEYNGTSGYEKYLTTGAADNPKTQATIALAAPTTQTSSISFSSVANSQMAISWTNGNGQKRAVFVKQASSGIASPVNDTTYTANTVFGSGTQIGTSGWYAVYNSTGTSVTITGLTASTSYIVQVFEYNGVAVMEKYFTDTAVDNPKIQVTAVAPTGDDFETGNFSANSWQFGGNLPWTVTSADKYAGTYSARSGAITHSQTSYMEVTANVQAGNISFYKKISSESGFDYLKFYIDGVLQTSSWSGEVAWSQSTYSVLAGSRTFRWIYSKDGSVNNGSDTAWVDNIVFPALTDATAPTISSISSDKANGSYKVGEIVDIDVVFSEAVTSTGNVTVTLETGTTDRTCTFTVTNAATGTCNYTVQSGDTSADLNTNSISGTIADQAGNPMSNFTPATNLAGNKAIVIDTTAPATPSASVSGGLYNTTQSIVLSSSGSSAIYYTTNGATPTTSSTLYSGAVSVSTSLTLKALAVDLAGNESGVSSEIYTIDVAGPNISSVVVTPSDTTALASWITDENASSQVEYGLTTSYGSFTSETNTSPGITSHTATVSSLVSCATYHLRVKSRDTAGTWNTSADTSFVTTGCAGESSVVAQIATEISNTTGGEVTFNDTDETTVVLVVPATATDSDATFQIKRIDKETALASISQPTDKLLAGSKIYDIKALTDVSTPTTSFSSAITVTVSYAASDLVGLEEPSLWIYRWNGVLWSPLLNCLVDTSVKTVSCTTTAFSTFGLFGSASESSSSSSRRDGDIDDEKKKCHDIKPGGMWIKRIVPLSSNSLRIDYTEAGGRVENYHLKFGTTSGDYISVLENIGGKGDLSYTLIGLLPATTYYIKVRAENGCETSEWSYEVSAKTLEEPVPEVPKQQEVKGVTDTVKDPGEKIVKITRPEKSQMNLMSMEENDPGNHKTIPLWVWFAAAITTVLFFLRKVV